MPTYEYLCEACGSRFERFQQITAAPVNRCPECGKKPRRLLGTGGAVITRSGAANSCRCDPGESCCDPQTACCGPDGCCCG